MRRLWAALGIVIGGGLLALTPCGVQPMQKRFAAVGRAQALALALRDYSYETKSFPKEGGLEVLVREGYVPTEAVLRDPWGREFKVRVGADGEAEVVSLGADGVPGGRGEAADLAIRVTRLDR